MWRFISSKFAIGLTALGLAFGIGLSEPLACPVCFTAAEGSRISYYGTTIGMTLIPFALVGGLVWWVRRNYFK